MKINDNKIDINLIDKKIKESYSVEQEIESLKRPNEGDNE